MKKTKEEIFQKAIDEVYDQVRFIEKHYNSLSINIYEIPVNEENSLNKYLIDDNGIPILNEEQTKIQEEINKASLPAHELISEPSILKYLCPGLKSITGDVFEIAKILVGVLLPLSLAGTITIVWNPLVIAAASFLIARAGIKSICH